MDQHFSGTIRKLCLVKRASKIFCTLLLLRLPAGDGVYASVPALAKMDLTADPCVDFHRFACGAYLDQGADGLTETPDILADRENSYKFKDLLENPADVEKDGEAFVKMKHFYTSCVNAGIANEGGEVLRDVVRASGPCPRCQLDCNTTGEPQMLDLEERLATLATFGIHPLFHLVLGQVNDSTVVLIDEAMPFHLDDIEGLAEDCNIWNSSQNFTRNLDKHFELFTIGEEDQEALLDFIGKFSEVVCLRVKKLEKGEREKELVLSPVEMAETYPQVDWEKLMGALFAKAGANLSTSDLQYVILAPTYIDRVDRLLRDTPHRVIADYLCWRFAEMLRFFLELPDDRHPISKTRWEACLQEVARPIFPHVVVSQFLKDGGYGEEENDLVQNMVGDLKKAFVENLHLQEWLDDQLISYIQQKIQNMKVIIGPPSSYLTSEEVDRIYSSVNVNSSLFIDNLLELRKFVFTEEIKGRTTPRNKDGPEEWSWILDPLNTNAISILEENIIGFSLGWMGPPFFSLNYSRARNFGGLGLVMAHEMMHGLEEEFLFRNGRDNPETKARYDNGTECLRQQYSNYVVEATGEKVNGTRTMHENIADNGALHLAYLALLIEEPGQETNPLYSEEEQTIPPFPANFTDKQVFFISSAQNFCERYDERFARKLKWDSHSPGKFRSIGPISNSRYFGETFNCAPGTPMNPIFKCQLWT